VTSIRSIALLVLPALLFCVSPPTVAAYSCSISTGGSINFLTYDPNAAPPTANATITLTCTHLGGGNEQIPWTMPLSNGSSGTCLGAVGRTMQRQASPAATVGYNIYQNSTAAEWGNAGCGTFPGGTLQVNNGNPVRSTVQTLRGVLPAGQLVPSGFYLETLVLTVTF
jgi:spore coat protein U-like protein